MRSSYPLIPREEVWEICLTMVQQNSPFPGFREEMAPFDRDFYEVFDRITMEHGRVKYKYYRAAGGNGIVNPLYVDHYAKLMHAFSHSLFLRGADRFLLDQIFLSIKGRTGMDLYYEVELGDHFIPLHGFGTILGRARYGRYFVVEQNCTVGNNHGVYPVFGDGVILRPYAAVLGSCNVGNNVQIAAGALVIDRDIPDNSIVMGRVPDLVIRENRGDNISLFFDIETDSGSRKD